MAKKSQEWLGDNSVNVLEWPSQSPDLRTVKHLWRDMKMNKAIHLQKIRKFRFRVWFFFVEDVNLFSLKKKKQKKKNKTKN